MAHLKKKNFEIIFRKKISRKILDKSWNDATFCHLGHYDLNTGEILSSLPGHTVS